MLDCPRGGPTAPIAVHFECNEVHVVSCKDLSNVVVEFEDGEHYKYDGLDGHYGTFGAVGPPRGQSSMQSYGSACSPPCQSSQSPSVSVGV